MSKQALVLEEDPLRIVWLFFLGVDALRYKIGHVRYVMFPSSRDRPEMYSCKHEICHFVPMLGPLKSGLRPSATILAPSGLGWTLFVLEGPQA